MSDIWLNIQIALDAGGVVLLPTETVYGLAARADDAQAISKIYAIKGRGFEKPLAVCVRGIEHAKTLAHFDSTSERLAEKYWPGSLTLVLNVNTEANLNHRTTHTMEGVRTVALRCPDVDWRESLNAPLALTSANRSGQADCVTFADALHKFGDELAGSHPAQAPLSGAPSTIIRAGDGQLTILRQGALEVEL